MSSLWEKFEEEIIALGAGIPEIREKISHVELEYDWLMTYMWDL